MCKCHIRSSRDLEVQRFNTPWEQWAAHSNKIAFPWTDQKNIQLESWNSKLRRQPIVRSALHMAWISCTAALFGRCSESKPNTSNKVEQNKLETWNTKLETWQNLCGLRLPQSLPKLPCKDVFGPHFMPIFVFGRIETYRTFSASFCLLCACNGWPAT